MLQQCGTPQAPWYVVPVDRKWYRDSAVAHVLREAFADLRLRYPEPDFDVARMRLFRDAKDEHEVNAN